MFNKNRGGGEGEMYDGSDSDDSDCENEAASKQRYYKVLFVGYKQSGAKTTFIRKYTGTRGVPAYKELRVQNMDIIFELWDDPDTFVKDADGIVIGYDITDRKSYNMALESCRSLVERNSRAVIMVLGNKVDLESERKVSTKEGEILADYINASNFNEGI